MHIHSFVNRLSHVYYNMEETLDHHESHIFKNVKNRKDLLHALMND